MPNLDALPGLKQILGALIFGSNRPLSLRELRDCLVEVAESDASVRVYADVDNKQLRDSLNELTADLERNHAGFSLHETAGGFRLQSDAECGRWLKHLLKAKPHRLSRPALETMAIIAYRQPISRADIETIRGVGVAHIIKALMEMQLVRIAGRSELPGRPFLYGTTHAFLDHFGLKDLRDLDRMAPMILSRQELKAAEMASEPVEEEPPDNTMELPFETPVEEAPPREAPSEEAPPEEALSEEDELEEDEFEEDED
jgi:segregation and condensation protein B